MEKGTSVSILRVGHRWAIVRTIFELAAGPSEAAGKGGARFTSLFLKKKKKKKKKKVRERNSIRP